MFPGEVGILVGPTKQYLVMETHFDNPTREMNRIDTSGLRVYYTDKTRKYEAGSLLLADSLIARSGEIVETGVRYQHTCPSVCTSRMSKPINIFASLLHMHTTGKSIYTNIFSLNNTFIKNLNKVGFVKITDVSISAHINTSGIDCRSGLLLTYSLTTQTFFI